MGDLILQHDIHMHTNLSLCAPRETTMATYLSLCEEEKISLLGFSDHLYYDHHLERRGITGETGLERVLKIREEMERMKDKTPVRMLLGCEVENFFGQPESLLPGEAGVFDYVLIAASHIMNHTKEYEKFDLTTPDKLRKMVMEQFVRACELEYPVPAGICHPLYPIVSPWEQEVVDGMTNAQLEECFKLAASKGKSIEIHACLYRNGTRLDKEGLSPSYLRLLCIAKECGCKFHFGSDAHNAEQFRGKHKLLLRAAERAGITSEDMWSVVQTTKEDKLIYV